MINPETPHPLFSRRPEIAPAPVQAHEESFHPRYVRLSALREHGHGPRNLAWGVVALCFAAGLLAVALFIAGPKALISLAVSLLTFTALFVLARMHVFRQRNGGFLALGIVCLFGAAMPLIERGYVSLEAFIKSRPIITAPVSSMAAVVPPASTAVEPPPLPLTEAFALAPPDPKSGPRVAAVKDFRVAIEGKLYLVKAGDTFPLAGKSGREVNIAIRDLLVTLPADTVEILDDKPVTTARSAANPPAGASPGSGKTPRPTATAEEPPAANETPAQITARAQREAIRRYPALGVKGSLENQMFLNLFAEIRDSGGDDFFKNPEWPIELSEMLARREHWTPGTAPTTVSPGSASATGDENPRTPAAR